MHHRPAVASSVQRPRHDDAAGDDATRRRRNEIDEVHTCAIHNVALYLTITVLVLL